MPAKPSALLDTRVIYCGDNLEQLRKLPDACVDLIYIDPPFNSNRNYEVFWGETKEKRAFADRHASTQAYIEFMRPRCVELHRVLGFGTGLDGVTTSIRNQTGREMTVRQITFVMNAAHFVLLPTGELTSSYKRENPKLTRAEIRRLKKGEAVQMKTQMQFRSWKVPPGLAGFVTLPPYTKTSFVLPAQFVANFDKPITGIRIVLEYATRTGEKKILHHDVKSKNLEHLQSTVDHFREEARSGRLNQARKISQMSEIPVKVKPTAPTGIPEKRS